MSEKPGCIHPGDPEGCLGTKLALWALALVAAALVVAGHIFMGRR